MTRRVYIIGHSAITCLGANARSTFEGLVEGRSGISTHEELPADRYIQSIAGRVAQIPSLPEGADSGLSRLNARFLHLAVAAAREAMLDAGLDQIPDSIRERVAVVVGSAFGGMDLYETEREAASRRKNLGTSPFLVPGMIINQAAGQIAQQLQVFGPSLAPANACATGGYAISAGAEMIRSSAADLAICGAAESAFTPEIVNGFATMKAMLGKKAQDRSVGDPSQASRPFSIDRAGFVMSEGAAVLVLAGESAMQALNLQPQAELIGWASNSDAYHMAMPNPERIRRCLQLAMAHAGVNPDQLDYYNAHGTSTVVNDRSETEAIRGAFGTAAESLAVSSIKGAIGHGLGAASAIEAACCVRSLLTQTIPPTINYIADPELTLDYVPNVARDASLDVVMSASFGFGGTNNALIFRKV